MAVNTRELMGDIARSVSSKGESNADNKNQISYITDIGIKEKQIITDQFSYKISSDANVSVISTYEHPEPENPTTPVSRLYVENTTYVSKGSTLITPYYTGFLPDGVTRSLEKLTLLVVNKGADDNGAYVEAIGINGKKIGDVYNCIPYIEEETDFLIAGGDSSIEMPSNEEIITQNIQDFVGKYIFQNEADIQQSLQQFNKSKELSLFFGPKTNVEDYDIKTCKGIWWQAKPDYIYTQNTPFDMHTFMTLAFYESSKESNKICLCGIDFTDTIFSILNDNICQSPYGTIKFIHYPILDIIDSRYGFVLDVADIVYLIKNKLSLTQNGNTVNIQESSAFILQHPKRHVRVQYM